MKAGKRFFILFTAFVFLQFFVSKITPVIAGDCTVTSFSYSPGSPVSWGTHVSLSGSGQCNGGVRAVRFTIDGQSKAEIGAPSQTETWKTEEFSPGNHTVCFEVAGGTDSSWGAGAQSCVGYQVTGGPSDQCYVDSFDVSPGSGAVGTTFTLSGSGHCDAGVRAVRFLINGAPFGEFGGPSYSTPWGTSGLAPGNYTIGFQVVHGDWGTAATSSKTVTLTSNTPPTVPPPSDQCYVDSFDVSPGSGVVGTTITLSGSGHCDAGVRAVRFLINGAPFGEFGGPSHSTPWGTSGLAPGNYTIGFQVVHGDWGTAATSSKTVTLTSNTPPTSPPPSDQCYVDSFDVSPGSGAVGTTITLSGSGHCDAGVRAVRFLINGTPFGEFGGPSHSTPWGTSGLAPGNYTIGFQVVHGDWGTAVTSSKMVTLTSNTSPTAPPPPTTSSPSGRCYVDSLDISPGSGPVGTTFTLSGSGHCDEGVRAVRFLINGVPFGEIGGPSHSTPWGTDGLAPGSYSIGFQVVHGDWGDATIDYRTVILTNASLPSSLATSSSNDNNSNPVQENNLGSGVTNNGNTDETSEDISQPPIDVPGLGPSTPIGVTEASEDDYSYVYIDSFILSYELAEGASFASTVCPAVPHPLGFAACNVGLILFEAGQTLSEYIADYILPLFGE